MPTTPSASTHRHSGPDSRAGLRAARFLKPDDVYKLKPRSMAVLVNYRRRETVDEDAD